MTQPDFPIDPEAAPLGFVVNPQTGSGVATGGNAPSPGYPRRDGDVTVLGPEVFVSSDGEVISWKGDNYVRASSAGVSPATDPTAPVCTCGGPHHEATLPSGNAYEEHRVGCALMQVDDTDLSEADVDRMMAAGTPVQIVTAPPATYGAVAATDQTALRDRIAAALHEQMPGCTHDEHGGDCRALADAVLSVLPASVDRADVLREAADICDEAASVYAERGADDPGSGASMTASALFALMERFQRKADEVVYVATPCDFVACEPGGEPCSTHERLMAHAEGDHELCGPDCGTALAVLPADATAAIGAGAAATPDTYEATTGHLITCLAVAGGDPDPDCPCTTPPAGGAPQPKEA